MTEAEWLACADPVAMVAFARRRPRATARVWRLFLAAFWGWQSKRLPDREQQDRLRQRVELIEQWAETGRKPAGVTVTDQTNVVFFSRSAAQAAASTAVAPGPWGKDGEAATAAQPVFLRELFGPRPLRPTAAEPEWLTSTVVALARGIYDEKAFDRMPYLADALQDAGCEDDSVLSHCRDAKHVHVRGCWVLDLMLGKA